MILRMKKDLAKDTTVTGDVYSVIVACGSFICFAV